MGGRSGRGGRGRVVQGLRRAAYLLIFCKLGGLLSGSGLRLHIAFWRSGC